MHPRFRDLVLDPCTQQHTKVRQRLLKEYSHILSRGRFAECLQQGRDRGLALAELDRIFVLCHLRTDFLQLRVG